MQMQPEGERYLKKRKKLVLEDEEGWGREGKRYIEKGSAVIECV
jgi:hypothetical protein